MREYFRSYIKKLSFPRFDECGPLELLILQPTTFCNIDCKYCYLSGRHINNKMSHETLESTCARVFESTIVRAPFTVAWHAGEPLVAGLDFYRNAFEVFRRHNSSISVRHSIQTNGMLINDEWAAFFKKYNVRVGISIDGPQFINDQNRLTRSGRSTFGDTMSGIEILRAHNVSFYTISVLSQYSLDFPDEIFNFLLSTGTDYICFNVEEIEANNHSSSLNGDSIYVIKDRYEKFLKRIISIIRSNRISVKVREVDGALSSIESWNGRHRAVIRSENQQVFPFKILTVAFNGDYSTFSPELLGARAGDYDTFTIGNVVTTPIRVSYDNPLFLRMYNDIRTGIDKCRDSCDYFQFCLGGTPANKIFENGSFSTTDTVFCNIHRKGTIDGVLSAFT